MMLLWSALLAFGGCALAFWALIKQQSPFWGSQQLGKQRWILGAVVPMGAVTVAMLSGLTLTAGLSGVDDYSLAKTVAAVAFALGFGLVGLLEDYLVVVKRRSAGLRLQQRLILQVLMVFCYLFTLQITGVLSGFLWMPFVGAVNFGGMRFLMLASLLLCGCNLPRVSIPQMDTATAFVAGLGGCLCCVLLDNHYGGMLFASLAGVALCSLWYFFKHHLTTAQSGRYFFSALLLAGCVSVDLAMFALPLAILYWLEGASYLYGYLRFELAEKPRTPTLLVQLQSKYTLPQLIILSAIITAVGVVITLFAIWQLVQS